VNDAQWEFFIDLRFATSGANYVDVYLMSDAADLTSGANGYFLRIGGTATGSSSSAAMPGQQPVWDFTRNGV
jgi:hypothetical protein